MLNSNSTKTTGKNRDKPTRGIVSTSETPAITGRTLGAFVVGDLLGEGGMGAVFHGRDQALDRPVAIKVLHTKLAADEEFVERFVREARTAAKLNHTNVVQIYGAGYDAGIAYMALELVEGCSLFDLYKAQRPFPARRACELIRDVSRGLAVAHDQGVIHRDIKPENILISEKGIPKLADFGLARASDQRITETGIFLGTPQYASPEQCNAAELTPASDLYSLGVVLYELLAGRPPYEAPTPLTLFKKILMEAPEPLSNYCPDLPPSLIALIERLLEKDPASRYHDAAVLAADLDRVLQGLPEVSADMDPYKLVPIVQADSRTVQTPASDSSRNLPFQETRGTTPIGPAPSDSLSTLKLVQFALAAVAAVLICAVIGLGLARLRHAPQPAIGPSPAVVQAPLRVAVIPWSNQAQSADFEWLGRALPDFLVSQLSQRQDAIKVEAPANVIEASQGLDLSDPSQRRALAQKLGVDLVIGGSFYVGAGGKVVLNAQVETDEGLPKQVPGSPAVFAREEVLGALNNFAEALALAIAGPAADTTVVASAPTSAEAQTARAADADFAPARAKRERPSEVASRQEQKVAFEKELSELEETNEGEATKKLKAGLSLRTLNETKAAKPAPAAPAKDEDEAAFGDGLAAPADRAAGKAEELDGSKANEEEQGAEKKDAEPETGGGGGGGADAEGARPGRAAGGSVGTKNQSETGAVAGRNDDTWGKGKRQRGTQGSYDEQQRRELLGSPNAQPKKPAGSAPPPTKTSSVASVESRSPAQSPTADAKGGQQETAAALDETAATTPAELIELRKSLDTGHDWGTYKALDACAQSENREVLRGALEAIGQNKDAVSDLYRKKLRAKLAR